MSLIEIQRGVDVNLLNKFIVHEQDGKFFVDLNLLDLDDDKLPETIENEDVKIRNSMFSNKYFGVNMLGAEAPIKNNLWNGPFGFIVSFHYINDVKFFICYNENNLPIMLVLGDDLPPFINQPEFENLINYDFNSNNQKLQNLVNNRTTDGLSLREEYVRLNNENGLLVDDSLTLFISFRYHLNKINEVYYKNLMNELLVNNFKPNLHTLRETDKFFIDGEIISFPDLQNKENKDYLISKILDFYYYRSNDLVLNYLKTKYSIDYNIDYTENLNNIQNNTSNNVILFENHEINSNFSIDFQGNSVNRKYILIDSVLAENFIQTNNGMPSFLRYNDIKYAILFQSANPTGWFNSVVLNDDSIESFPDLSTFQFLNQNIQQTTFGTNIYTPTIGVNSGYIIFHKQNNFYWAHTLNGSNNIVNIEIVSLTEVPVVGPSNGSSSATVGWDGTFPPSDGSTAMPVRDAVWDDGGWAGPGGPVLVGNGSGESAASVPDPISSQTDSTPTSTSVVDNAKVDVGNGVTKIPPPTPTPTPTPTQIGDWSGNNVSGPTGPISNQNNETPQSETMLPGSIFRMFSGYKNKFFPYSVTNVEQTWQHNGEKVVVMATSQNTIWCVSWNIGIRSSTDIGTQFKLENYRNPKDSETVILNFPKLKSNALQTDDIKFYVEKIHSSDKWNVYVPTINDLPLFTIEPKLGCTFSHNQRDGWIHNESNPIGDGVQESGFILTKLDNNTIINSDLEVYVACTGTNLKKTSIEIVFSKITLKANHQGAKFL